jgi:hypothetical protein
MALKVAAWLSMIPHMREVTPSRSAFMLLQVTRNDPYALSVILSVAARKMLEHSPRGVPLSEAFSSSPNAEWIFPDLMLPNSRPC